MYIRTIVYQKYTQLRIWKITENLNNICKLNKLKFLWQKGEVLFLKQQFYSNNQKKKNV